MTTWNVLENLIINNNFKQLQQEIENDQVQFLPFGAHDIVQVILENGKNINKKNAKGETALMVAAAIRNFNMTQYLLQQGADVSARHKYGESAFDIAMEYDQKDSGKWFELFALYKEKFDEKDLARYYEYRLRQLLA